MNTQNQACQSIAESPIQRAQSRLMGSQNETEKLIEELKERLVSVLLPLVSNPQPTASIVKTPPRDLASPLTDGTNDRAGQQDIINSELRDILSRVEL